MKQGKWVQLVENLGFSVLFDEPMNRHTTFRIGGPADAFIKVNNCDKLPELLEVLNVNNIPITVIGGGSNLLISDNGIEGAVLYICDDRYTCDGDSFTAFSGLKLSKMCQILKQNSLSGAEFAFGIPGTVGGAVYMNAGAYGGEIVHIIDSCKSITRDGKIIERTAKELKLGYRTSIFKENDEIIISATFKLNPGNEAEIEAQMNDFLERRRNKQPLEFPSAGSAFKRPVGYYAGALIEQCGLKGFSVGDAEVSKKHAGFVINKGNATCDDVLNLIESVKEKVLGETGVSLEPEVIFKGR